MQNVDARNPDAVTVLNGLTESPDIEITPEMIEAGLDEIWNHPITEPMESELRVAVAAVYRAMFQARGGR